MSIKVGDTVEHVWTGDTGKVIENTEATACPHCGLGSSGKLLIQWDDSSNPHQHSPEHLRKVMTDE